MNITKRRRLGAGTAIFAAAALALSGAGMAFAADEPPASSVIDPNAQGSITVHKHETPGGAPGDGSELNPGPGTDPVAGVEFTLSRVTHQGTAIDPSTNLGQSLISRAADEWTGTAFPQGSEFGTVVVDDALTDSAGVLVFDPLDLGLYLVEETMTPAGVAAGQPFLVTVPISQPGVNGANDSWLYNVHVYPKNGVTPPPEKLVSDSNAVQAGDPITWTINVTLVGAPYDANNDGQITGDEAHWFTRYSVRDPLLAQLAYAADSQTVEVDGVALDPADYAFTQATPSQADQDKANPNTVGEVLVWEFAEGSSGLSALRAAGDNGTLSIKFVTTTVESGVIPNIAEIYTNGYTAGDEAKTPETGGPLVTDPAAGGTTKVGGITVLKTAEQSGDPLAGAVFEVYVDPNNDGVIEDNAETADIDESLPLSVTVNGATTSTWTTSDPDGTVVIDGLRYSNWADGETLESDDERYIHYLLKEITAPTGYSPLAQPVPFTVTAPADQASSEVPVTNVQKNAGFVLPMTGGTGVALFVAAGVILIGGGALVLFVILARRRKAAQEEANRSVLVQL